MSPICLSSVKETYSKVSNELDEALRSYREIKTTIFYPSWSWSGRHHVGKLSEIKLVTSLLVREMWKCFGFKFTVNFKEKSWCFVWVKNPKRTKNPNLVLLSYLGKENLKKMGLVCDRKFNMVMQAIQTRSMLSLKIMVEFKDKH